MMTDFWAKTPGDKTPEWNNIHTVFHHLIDVGLVFEELLKGAWAGIGEYLTSAFAQKESGLRTLCVLAAVHDIGKISPGFQKKVGELVPELKDEGFCFHPGDTGNHGFTSFEFLIRRFASLSGPKSRDIDSIYAQASACHHGSYFSISPTCDRIPDSSHWETARIEHFKELCRLWDIDPEDFPVPSNPPPPCWTAVLAGAISVADWVGSSLDFPLEAGSLGKYVKIRRDRISETMTESGFAIDPPTPQELSFESLFAPKREESWKENKTQKSLRELTEGIDGPFMALVESPTGVGKTEASLQVYARMARRRARGLYFALPTMATTNAMFSRIHGFLNRLFAGGKTQIKLLSSEAPLHKEFSQLLAARGSNGPEADDAVRAYEWFNEGSKRGLLAEHAVGTVDQAMMAAMRSRHHFVRLLGLTDKLVVIDEIHAYDTYMQAIIESLLAWLRGLDTPVILLSATLPKTMRRHLLAAYAGKSIEDDCLKGPNVTVWSEKGLESRAIDELPDRQVGIKLHESSDNSSESFVCDAADLTLEAVKTGGCVACIVNTVDEAQKVFERLDSRLDPDVPRVLVHARFMRKHRSDKEKLLQKQFGRDGRERPERAVVVSTQILEQSLDVDFDTMISDLAPIDLLIQRLGRVHRHLRDRRPHPRPILTVVSPPRDDMKPRVNVLSIYEPVVLVRTALALAQLKGELTIPKDDGKLLEDVYGTSPIGDPDLDKRLEEWEADQQGRDAADRFWGKTASLGKPEEISADMCSVGALLDFDERPPTTRLGGESQTVVVFDGPARGKEEELIEQSVRIGHRHLVRRLKDLREGEVPQEWKKHWFLCRCVPLYMEEGPVSLGGYRLSYCEKRGLIIEKEGG